MEVNKSSVATNYNLGASIESDRASKSTVSSKGPFQFLFEKTSGLQFKNWLPSFFNSSLAEKVNDPKEWLSWGKTIKQVAPPLSKEAIREQGSLFSSRDFQKIASSRVLNFFGRPFDPDRKPILRALQDYRSQLTSFSAEEKWNALDALEIKTQRYHGDKRTITARLSLESSERVNVEKDIQAAKLLLQGISLEKQKLIPALNKQALERQKTLAGESPFINLEKKFSKDGAPVIAAGEMATLDVVTYNVNREGDEPRTGYFKPVGNDTMNSKVGKGLGISEASTAIANLSGRAVATYRVSQLLELSSSTPSHGDLVPETNFAIFGDKYGVLQQRAEGGLLTTEETQEKTIPSSQVDRDEPIIAVALTGAGLESGETLQVDETFVSLNSAGRVCDKDLNPLSRKKISELVRDKKISLEPKIISRLLEKELVNFTIDVIKDGEMSSLACKDPSLAIRKDAIYENDQPITLERAAELARQKKIVVVKKIITSVNDVDFKNSQLQKELSDAHLLDLLTGQVDRHANNFIYQKKENDWHVKLIDNDLSFPAKLNHVDRNLLPQENIDVLVRSPMPKLLPRLVSRTTAEKILRLTPEALQKALEKTGLSEEEIESTKGRLEGLQAHLQNLSNNIGGRLVDEWNDETYNELMQQESNYIYQSEDGKKIARDQIKAAQVI